MAARARNEYWLRNKTMGTEQVIFPPYVVVSTCTNPSLPTLTKNLQPKRPSARERKDGNLVSRLFSLQGRGLWREAVTCGGALSCRGVLVLCNRTPSARTGDHNGNGEAIKLIRADKRST